jgi:hypothetical protein
MYCNKQYVHFTIFVSKKESKGKTSAPRMDISPLPNLKPPDSPPGHHHSFTGTPVSRMVMPVIQRISREGDNPDPVPAHLVDEDVPDRDPRIGIPG